MSNDIHFFLNILYFSSKFDIHSSAYWLFGAWQFYPLFRSVHEKSFFSFFFFFFFFFLIFFTFDPILHSNFNFGIVWKILTFQRLKNLMVARIVGGA